MEKTLENTGHLDKYVNHDHYELVRHGFDEFRMSAHKTYVRHGISIALYYHWHEELEIFFVTKGKMRFFIGHKQYMISRGDILTIPPNVPHMAYREGKDDIEFYAILVHVVFVSSQDYDLIQSQYILPVFTGQKKIMKKINRNNKYYIEIRQKIECILKFYHMEYKGYELMIKSCLYSILYYLISDSGEAEDDDNENYNLEWVRDFLYYIKNHYSQKVTLTDMANHVHMSNSYFCRSVKKVFKMSPMEFLNRYRVMQSLRLLQNTDKKLGDIAFEMGFSNANSFTHSFKKVMGCVPSQLRQKFKKK